MNIQSSAYLHYTFQTCVNIDIDIASGRTVQGTFVYVSKIIHNWITQKFPALNLPSYPGNFQKNQYTQTVETLYSYNDCFYCIKTTHTDKEIPNRIWITEAEIHKKDEKLFLGVKNAYTSNSPKNEEDYIIFSVPLFVKNIAKKVTLLDVGETIENIATIDSPDKLTDLYKLITNPSRQLPVIVISENTSLDNISAKYFAVNDSYLLDGTCLAEDLKFISHIFYLPSEYQTSWCNLIGSNWGLYNGAVRTYYPNFSIDDNQYYNHPIIIPQKILSMNYVNSEGKEYLGGHAFRKILTRTLKNFNMHNRFSWAENDFQFFYKANRAEKILKHSSNKNTQEWCALLEEDNEELNKQLQETQALLEAQDQEMGLQNETIRKFESINIYNQTRIYNLEQALLKYQQQPDPLQYPNNYSDIPEWINNNFSGRIELLPRAVRSLKDALYKDINLVCQLIECLGTTYYNMRLGFVDKQLYDNTLKNLGVEDLPAISDSSAGQQGDEYYPLYNVGAGMDLSSALSDEDIAGQDELTVCSFRSKTLRLTVAAVLGRTHTFFMCH